MLSEAEYKEFNNRLYGVVVKEYIATLAELVNEIVSLDPPEGLSRWEPIGGMIVTSDIVGNRLYAQTIMRRFV